MASHDDLLGRVFAGIDAPEVDTDDDDELATVAGIRRMFRRVADAISASGDAVQAVSRFTDSIASESQRQAEEIAELRAAIHTLANRIESTNRALAQRTDHLA